MRIGFLVFIILGSLRRGLTFFSFPLSSFIDLQTFHPNGSSAAHSHKHHLRMPCSHFDTPLSSSQPDSTGSWGDREDVEHDRGHGPRGGSWGREVASRRCL